ncbi:MAG TPA: heparinase II/III family protein [Caulobacteraceae bacterium]|nr:heparinase II/III family protein [Caulobacteraceae bacterium]
MAAGRPPSARIAALAPPSAPSWAAAALRFPAWQAREEWFGSPPHLWSIARPRPDHQAAAPRDFRPADLARGRAVLAGGFAYDGLELQVGSDGDPWDRPAPSRAFAAELHRMDWLRDVLAADEAGPEAALGLVHSWTRLFGRWNRFSWSAACLPRRVFNLACSLKLLSAQGEAAQARRLLESLARQARHLLLLNDGPRWAAERAAIAAVAGASLAGPAGERLLAKGLERLTPALKATVLGDGGHASRSPEAGLELLLDLLTLDDALLQLGRPAPVEMARAIDRLGSGLRFFTLADGRLASFQGGEASEAARVMAAASFGEAAPPSEGLGPPPSPSAPHSGYEKLLGRRLQLIVDAAAPATGAWSETACAQPLAIEILAGPDRLITGSAWSCRAEGAPALRLTAGASTATLGRASAGQVTTGPRARVLGPWLEGGASVVRLSRHDADAGVWLELAHDGWTRPFGLVHERRLYLDIAADELRGEDRVRPDADVAATESATLLAVRFHVQPGVDVAIQDGHKAIVLTGPSGQAWRLRHDAAEASLEPSMHLQGGRPRRTSQILLQHPIRADRTARVRWKLAAADA